MGDAGTYCGFTEKTRLPGSYPRASPQERPQLSARERRQPAAGLSSILITSPAEIRQQLRSERNPAPYCRPRGCASLREPFVYFPPFSGGGNRQTGRRRSRSIDIVRLFVQSQGMPPVPDVAEEPTNSKKSRTVGENAVNGAERMLAKACPAAAVLSPGSADHCRGADDLLDLGSNGADHIRNITAAQFIEQTVRRHRRRAGRGAVREPPASTAGRRRFPAPSPVATSTWVVPGDGLYSGRSSRTGRCSTCRSTAPSASENFLRHRRRGDRARRGG